jgi:hypothetical protein
MSLLNEVQFVAEVKSWVDEICRSRGAKFPFAGAEIEKRVKGKRERRDLVLRDRRGKTVLTGEIKLPDRPDGRTPYAADLVEDAHAKADAEGVEYFFTWNINKMVLWQTFRPGTPVAERGLEFFDWFDIQDADVLSRPEVQESVRARLREFLDVFADIYRHVRTLRRLPLDKLFIHALESALDGPANLTRTAITRRAQTDTRFRDRVRRWVSRNLGGEYGEDQRELMIETAARFSCYVLAIKIVFYDALRRKHDQLPALTLPRAGLTAGDLKERLARAFRRAEKASGDYETVFQGDDLGDSLPLLVDEVVDDWRLLIKQVDEYDFTHIEYDIIGMIFNGLTSPEERHRYGQHYTKSEIVDLINAFCIRKPDARVIDPACGGGTFLVRAYARKKWLEQQERKSRSHEERLGEIFGVDVSTYASHLTVVSLATRDLGRVANYPRVACKDFFEVKRSTKIFPASVEQRGGKPHTVSVAAAEIDAVIGNPPYVRQEALTAEQKRDYAAAFTTAWPDLKVSGRSDLHIYFWPHATSFLPEEDGYFGFLTSSSWLDVEYGFPLQRWILQNFCIEAIMESSVEPWFTDARVATAVTILRREPDLTKRMSNLVRFVQIRRPLDDILVDVQHGDDRIAAVEELRRRILAAKKNSESRDWRIRVVRQRELIQGDHRDNPAHHTGGKWGIPLRAPDIYFELMDRFGDKFVPLRELAEVRFGLKTGCDAFFFPRDITEQEKERLADREFRDRWGITKKQSDKIRICKAGDGSVHLIEAEYLEPVISTVMELDSVSVEDALLEHHVLLVSKPKSQLRGAKVLQYIKYGETHHMGTREQSFVHRKDTVAARAREGRFWYDLTDGPRPALCWPKAHQYKHIVSRNPKRWILNCRLYAVDPRAGVLEAALHGVLLSTPTVLMKFLYGRSTGREGNLDTMVSDAEMMPVPDVRLLTPKSLDDIVGCVAEAQDSKIDTIPSEISGGDRRRLDHAVLAGLGVSEASERERLISSLYESLSTQLSETRRLELIAQKNRLSAARKTDSLPESTAGETWKKPDDDADETE